MVNRKRLDFLIFFLLSKKIIGWWDLKVVSIIFFLRMRKIINWVVNEWIIFIFYVFEYNSSFNDKK